MSDIQDEKFIQLLVKNQPRIHSFVTVLLPGSPAEEDIYQETCFKLWEKRSRYDPNREFLPWAYSFARHEVLKFLERQRDTHVYLSSAMVAELAEAQIEPDVDFDARREALNRCLMQLSPKQRNLIERCYQGDEPKKTIAEKLRISTDALYMRLSRIRRLLVECVTRSLAMEVEP